MKNVDVVVIGGGLLGCFAARNLCRRNLHIALLEAREDVCTGISRANTAIVYPGYDHKPGTLKAEMCVRANARFDALCREMDVPFSRCGSLMVSFGPQADAVLQKKYENGLSMGVPGLRLLTGEEAAAMEPSLAAGVSSTLYAPTAGTVNPWELGIAASENAAANGAELCLNTRVQGIRRTMEGYRVETDHGDFSCRAVVNCAGINADRVQALLFPTPVRIAPDAADYLILDKASANRPSHIIQYEPEDGGKGFNAVPTVEGSLLLGPSERENEVDFAASAEGLSFVRERAGCVLPGHPLIGRSVDSAGVVCQQGIRGDPALPHGVDLVCAVQTLVAGEVAETGQELGLLHLPLSVGVVAVQKRRHLAVVALRLRLLDCVLVVGGQVRNRKVSICVSLRLLTLQRAIVPVPHVLERQLLLAARARVDTVCRRLLIQVAAVALVLSLHIVRGVLVGRTDLLTRCLLRGKVLVVGGFEAVHIRLRLLIVHASYGLPMTTLCISFVSVLKARHL